MSKSSPPPPDFMGLAHEQSADQQKMLNQQTQANRPNTNTPWASQQWKQNPDGSWTQNTGFNGQLGDLANTLQGQAKDAMSTQLDNGSAVRDQAINATYNQASSRLNPMWNQRQEQMDAQLANSGLDPNSQAYRNAQQQFGQQRNDAYGSAMNSAIQNGNEAQNLTFNQNLAARNAPMQELQQMQGFLAQPGFNAAGVGQAPDLLGAGNMLYQGQMNQFQNDNALTSGLIGGVGNLLGGLTGGLFKFGK